MRALHFAALAHERAAQAVQTQSLETLLPFISYLSAAIEAAKERQVRYRVAWSAIPDPQRIRLRALDSLVDVPPEPLRYRVEGWPAGIAPNPLAPLMVVTRSLSIPVKEVELLAEGPQLTVEQPILAEDTVFWGGKPCRLIAVTGARVNKRVFDEQGRPRTVRDAQPQGDAKRWIIEGEVGELFDESSQPLQVTVLDPFEGLTTLVDEEGQELTSHGSQELEVTHLPANGALRGNNGLRFGWEPLGGRGRKQQGTWVQLVTPENVESDATVDPRAAFCEEGVSEVRIEGGQGSRQPLRVRGFKRDSYQLLLERLPPEGSLLQLPIDLKNLFRQHESLRTLRDAPLPHHQGLIRLLEDPARVRWSAIEPQRPTHWHVLTDTGFDGTEQQRDFVSKALATTDFAFLEGPPGSGKTHAICELVLQLLAQGKRILLCSTTHVAVDNVLERLVGRFPQVEAVRIGRVERVDRRVRDCQLDVRIESLTEHWRQEPHFNGMGDEELEKLAEGVVLDSANLTCGTTLGILAHPSLRDEARAGSKHPRFDVLILDETSKTTFQEFLVPALFARRWVVVGDVRQLPPFTERADLEAALRDLVPGNRSKQRYSLAHQRACLLLQRLSRHSLRGKQVRWIVTEEEEVLSYLARELHTRATEESARLGELEAVRIVETASAPASARYAEVTLTELERGAPHALRVLGASVVLVEPSLLPRVERWLPPELCWVRPAARAKQVLAPYRRERWRRFGALPAPVYERGRPLGHADKVEEHEAEFLSEKSWASEVGWRLVRLHELGTARGQQERERIQRDLSVLLPRAAPEVSWVKPSVMAVLDIGLRSVIEVLQAGVGDHHARRQSALTQGLPDFTWRARAALLSHQHRMHPDISLFPRETFYRSEALKDANTLEDRDEKVGWSFGAKLPARRAWVNVKGKDERGVNAEEVKVMRRWLESFLKWAQQNPPRKKARWEVACLSFYVRQELAIRDMLRSVTKQPRHETRFEVQGVELTCGTVDRFQGREADMVLLSMRNTKRVGFLDSPHRLNVALTRARHQLLVLGHREYFMDCGVEELESLARKTASVSSDFPGTERGS